MSEQVDDVHDPESGINRRSAIVKGVAAATAAGVVWSAPRIEGLSLRPNYAAAQSGPQMLATTVNRNTSGNFTNMVAMCPQGNVTVQAQFAEGTVTGRGFFTPSTAGTINAINIAPGTISASFNNAPGTSVNTGGSASSVGDATITITYTCA